MSAETGGLTVIQKDRELVVSRLFDAPRELVFEAWTDPEQVGKWWGPDGFTTTTHEMEVRPGGVWRFIMHGPDGTDWPNRIEYLEVKKPEKLVYHHTGDGNPDDTTQFDVTVTFEDEGGKTNLTMRMVFPSAEQLNAVVEQVGAIEGARQHLGRLAEHLAGN